MSRSCITLSEMTLTFAPVSSWNLTILLLILRFSYHSLISTTLTEMMHPTNNSSPPLSSFFYAVYSFPGCGLSLTKPGGMVHFFAFSTYFSLCRAFFFDNHIYYNLYQTLLFGGFFFFFWLILLMLGFSVAMVLNCALTSRQFWYVNCFI